jgi:hypothetical protein
MPQTAFLPSAREWEDGPRASHDNPWLPSEPQATRNDPTIFWRREGKLVQFRRGQNNVAGIFHELVDQWRRDTAGLSSSAKIAMHPAYQQMIGLGLEALPFIFREMSQPSASWFWALRAIVGQDIAASHNDVVHASRAWLSWGIEQGYID